MCATFVSDVVSTATVGVSADDDVAVVVFDVVVVVAAAITADVIDFVSAATADVLPMLLLMLSLLLLLLLLLLLMILVFDANVSDVVATLLLLLLLLLGTQVCCILHNMLLKYNGLDTIGNFANDYGTDPTVDDDSDVEMEEDPHMVDVDANVDVVHPIEIEPEVQVGYAEKKGLLFMHHKYACN